MYLRCLDQKKSNTEIIEYLFIILKKQISRFFIQEYYYTLQIFVFHKIVLTETIDLSEFIRLHQKYLKQECLLNLGVRNTITNWHHKKLQKGFCKEITYVILLADDEDKTKLLAQLNSDCKTHQMWLYCISMKAFLKQLFQL